VNAVAKIGGERFGGIVGLLLGVVLVLSVVCYGGPTLTTIAQFNGTNGGFPLGELVMGANGNIFGTTAVGGNDFVNLNQIGYGTVFELSGSAHTLSTVASFDNTDGNQPTEI
jgi:hypothetical protein